MKEVPVKLKQQSSKNSGTYPLDSQNLFHFEKQYLAHRETKPESPSSQQNLIGSKRPRRAVKKSRYEEENYVSSTTLPR